MSVPGLALRAWYRTGRRGATLLFLAFLDALVGYSLLAAPSVLARINLLLPITAWAAIWIAVGAVCAVCAPLERDWAAFTTAAALKAGWAAANCYAWVAQGLPRGWVTVAVWLAFGALVLLIGSWPESPVIMAARARGKAPPSFTPGDGARR